ncbi:hypothetical protein DMENIID0001_107520 [Sergentomyia squamirostris]
MSTSAQTKETKETKCWLNYPNHVYNLMSKAVREFLEKLHVNEWMNHVLLLSTQYPLVFFAAVALILTTAFPITLFFLFVMCSIVFGFTGLILIEGALITTGSLVMCGFIGSLIVILLIAAASIFAGYFGFTQLVNLF